MFVKCARIVLQYVIILDNFWTLKFTQKSDSKFVRFLGILGKYLLLFYSYLYFSSIVEVCYVKDRAPIHFYTCLGINTFQVFCTIVALFTSDLMEHELQLRTTVLRTDLLGEMKKLKRVITIPFIIECVILTIFLVYWPSKYFVNPRSYLIVSVFWEYSDILRVIKFAEFNACLLIIGKIANDTNKNFNLKRKRSINDLQHLVDQYQEYLTITNRICSKYLVLIVCVFHRDFSMVIFLIYKVFTKKLHNFSNVVWIFFTMKRTLEFFFNCFYLKHKVDTFFCLG